MKSAPIIIVIYMLAALCWWTYLLYSKNEIIYNQQVRLIELEEESYSSESREEIDDTFRKQKSMIIGEGIVFTLALIAGVFYLWVAYKRNLKSSERQKNFLLSVTHELKSPMASIKLAFETIKRRNLTEDQNKKISTNGIIEVDRLHKQVENILVATSIDQRYYVQRSEASIPSLIELIRKSRHHAPGSDRTKYEFDSESEDIFLVDINGVLQITENLLENALKYSSDIVIVELIKKLDILHILVKDQGPGIDVSERENIFKRFYRIGNEETRSSKGTGLGLYIVKHIVTKNKGRIYLKENQPEGTIFVAEIKIE